MFLEKESTPMKKILILIALSIFVSACKHPQENTPATTLKRKGIFSANSLSQLSLFNMQNANADIVLRYSGALTDWGSGNTSVSAIGNAVFTNDSLPEAVSSVSVNGVALTIDSSSLIYSTLSDAAFANPNTANWSVTGYEGSNFTENSSSPSTISITSPHPGDTVSASAGFTATYSGSNGGDLIANVSFDPASNMAAGDTATAMNGTGTFETTLSDVGSAAFTSGNLAGITNGWVNLDLTHWEFNIDTLTNGKTVINRVTYGSNIYIYLKP
jgi:hypothetical protein